MDLQGSPSRIFAILIWRTVELSSAFDLYGISVAPPLKRGAEIRLGHWPSSSVAMAKSRAQIAR
jgi:hypothetical protein